MEFLVQVFVPCRITIDAVNNTCTERTVSTFVARFNKKLNRFRFIVHKQMVTSFEIAALHRCLQGGESFSNLRKVGI